jgi:hypothetical protein
MRHSSYASLPRLACGESRGEERQIEEKRSKVIATSGQFISNWQMGIAALDPAQYAMTIQKCLPSK